MMQSLSKTQLANIEFHRLLASQYEQQPFFGEANRARVRSLLQELAGTTSSERLLDIGCGTGLILDLAHDIFKQLDGIDITPEMLERVNPKPNISIQVASAEDVPFRDATFDAVTAYSVLHHIEDLEKVFREVRRVLKPEGFFYADESPSQHYRDAIFGIDTNKPMSATLQHEHERVTSDLQQYGTKFAIPAEIVERAMTQNFALHKLEQENLERLLFAAGFHDVKMTFRWYIGEAAIRREYGEVHARTVGEYLQQMLPLTRHLFKYFVLVAR